MMKWGLIVNLCGGGEEGQFTPLGCFVTAPLDQEAVYTFARNLSFLGRSYHLTQPESSFRADT